MPHPLGNIKQSGDVHLPDAESDLDIEHGTTGLAALAHERQAPGRPHVRKAGLVMDDQANQHRHDSGTARDLAGEAPTGMNVQPRTDLRPKPQAQPQSQVDTVQDRSPGRPLRTRIARAATPALKWAGIAAGTLLIYKLCTR